MLPRWASPWQRRTRPSDARARNKGLAIGKALAAGGVQPVDHLAWKLWLVTEYLRIAIDDSLDRRRASCDPSEIISTLMRRADGYGERLGELRRDAACARQMVEGLALVEPRHFDGPFDHRAVAADFEAVMFPGNRNDASIEIRGETAG